MADARAKPPRGGERPDGRGGEPSRPIVTPEPQRPPGMTDESIVRMLRVPPESAGMRVDRFVQSQLRNTSRTRAQVIVAAGAHRPDGRRLRGSDRVRAEDWIALWRAPPDASDDSPIPVLYEDPHLLVVDKPPLMAVHPTARHHRGTVIKQLERDRPDDWLSLVHRLDRETSGVLLLARSPAADRAFKRLLEDRSLAESVEVGDRDVPKALRQAARRGALAENRVEKTYLAICWGHPADGLVELPLEPDPDNPLRVKMRVARPGRGQVAATTLRTLARLPGYALVACRLHTGRQHQIRVHLQAAGCPVVGDKLYGPDERMLARAADDELSDEDLQRLELPRQALHAHRYELRHPIGGAPLSLVAPLPADLRAFWESRGGDAADADAAVRRAGTARDDEPTASRATGDDALERAR